MEGMYPGNQRNATPWNETLRCPQLRTETAPGEISKRQTCHFSHQLFSYGSIVSSNNNPRPAFSYCYVHLSKSSLGCPGCPAIRGAGELALPEQTSLTHGELLVKRLMERQQCYQLLPQSQPAVSLVWQMTLTSADMRVCYWSTYMLCVDGRGWWVEVRPWRVQGSFLDCILCNSSPRQAWTDKLPWWHHSGWPLWTHPCTVIFSL